MEPSRFQKWYTPAGPDQIPGGRPALVFSLLYYTHIYSEKASN